MGVPSVDRNPKVLPWPRSWQRAAADEDSDSPAERLLRWSERVVAPCDRVAQCLPVYGQLGSSVGQEVQPVFDEEPGFDHLGSRPGPLTHRRSTRAPTC